MSILADTILDQIQSFLLWLIGLLPDASVLSAPQVSSYLKHADMFINMTLLTTLLSIFLAYEGLVLIVRAILTVWEELKP